MILKVGGMLMWALMAGGCGIGTVWRQRDIYMKYVLENLEV